MNREEALEAIDKELDRTRKQIEAEGHATKFSAASSSGKAKGDDVKLVVISGTAAVKVEVNYIFRGTLLEPVRRPLTQQAEDTSPASSSRRFMKPNSTAASLWPHWTASIRAICST